MYKRIDNEDNNKIQKMILMVIRGIKKHTDYIQGLWRLFIGHKSIYLIPICRKSRNFTWYAYCKSYDWLSPVLSDALSSNAATKVSLAVLIWLVQKTRIILHLLHIFLGFLPYSILTSFCLPSSAIIDRINTFSLLHS